MTSSLTSTYSTISAFLPPQPFPLPTAITLVSEPNVAEEDFRAVLRSCQERFHAQNGQLVLVTQAKWQPVIAEYFDVESARPVSQSRPSWLARFVPAFTRNDEARVLLSGRPRQ